MNNRTSYRVVCLMFTSIVLTTCGGKTGGQDLSRELQSDESVETISVMLQVGGGGSDLDEPVALDLGLGFPLWLEPLGREPDEVAPFGAIPQQTTADKTLRAGASATFTFSASETDPGKDETKATPQLLNGVQVADISRVGFASRGETDWILGAYEVRINGKLVASKSESLASSTDEGTVDGKASSAVQNNTLEAATDDVILLQSTSPPQDDSGAVGAGQDGSVEENATTEGVETATSEAATSEAGAPEDTSISQQDEATLKARLADLQSLVQTGLANTGDKDKLAQVQAALEKLANAPRPQSATTASPARGPVNHDSVLQVQEAARLKRVSLETTISELQSELQKLESLAELQLAEDVDEQVASQVESQLKSLRLERDQLNRQLDGKFPWFIDSQFTSPWRDDTTIESAKVTLVTEEHLGADTQNYVYLQIGGHKYLLGSPAVPLAGATGPQEFALQMDSGPLTKNDLRGWSVGMLGSPLPFGKAPDRWHPKRIVIELDGKIAYDSEEVETDRNSLAAIRLIPPAHYDEEGNLVVNKPIAREVFVWEAGKAAGLNLADGGTFDLPDANDPNYPQSEPGLPQQTSPADSFADSSLFPGEQGGTGSAALADTSGLDASGLGTSGLDAWGTGSSALDSSGFDSSGLDSSGLGSWGSGSGGYGGYGSPGDYGNGWGSSGGYGSGWGSKGTSPGQGLTVPPSTPPVPPEKDPPATGTPFQIESVRITAGWTSIDKFTVEWNVAGDESEIDFYNVALRVVRPDEDQVFFSNVLRAQVSAGSRSYTGTIDSSAGVSEPYYYVAPIVTAVSKDSQQTPHERIGPARAIFPASSSLKPFVPLQLDSRFGIKRTTPSGLPTLSSMPVSYAGEPAGSSTAVWTTQDVEESHNAILFDNPAPALTVAARPTAQDDAITFSLSVPSLQKGVYKLVGHLGYLGKTSTNSITTAEVLCRLDSAGSSSGKPLEMTKKLTFGSVGRPDTSRPASMAMLEQVIDTGKLTSGTEPFDLLVSISLSAKSLDPLHPPAVFGLRLLPDTETLTSPSIVKSGKLLSPKMTVKTYDYQTFSNNDWPDLVCRVESGVYSSITTGALATPMYQVVEGTHFLDVGRVKVTVENLGGKPSKQCKLGIISVGPTPDPKTPIELADKTPKGMVKGTLQLIPPPTSALPGASTGTGPSTKIKWIATESVPPLAAKDKKDIYLALPNNLIQALGEDLSSERYRVMVDMDEQYAVQEDDNPKGPGETNNWSNTFFIKEGPYIADFTAKQNTLVPEQKLEISGSVYGSSRWDLTYEWLGTNTSLKKVFDADPLQKKPFPKLSSGVFMTLPWVPWRLNQPEMNYPKLKVTLTAYNSTGSRKDSKDASIDLNDFDGTFQVKEAKAYYMEQVGKVVGSMKVDYDCDKPFKVGLFGDPGFGSVYVRCQILNPVEPVYAYVPNVNIKSLEFHVLCKSVHKDVHCVVPDAPKLKAKKAYQASMSPLPVQDLPAKGTFLVAWEADIGQNKLEAISRTYKVGNAQATTIYQPIVRAELRIHTGKQTVSLKERIELVASSGAKFGTNVKEVKFSDIDESLFWITEDWDW